MKLLRRDALGLITAGALSSFSKAKAQSRELYSSGHKRNAEKWVFRGSLVQSMLAVPVIVGGQEELLFEVCSTCSGVSIRFEIAEKLGLKGRSTSFSGRIEDFELSKQTALQVLSPDWSLPQPLAGVIGLDVFYDLSIGFNFKTGALQVGPVHLPEPDGLTVFSYAESGKPTVPVTIGAQTFDALIATGQIRAPILVTTETAGRVRTLNSREAGEAHQGSQVFRLTEYELVDRPRVGLTPLDVNTVTTPTPIALASLGALGLMSKVVHIDRKNQRVQIING